MKLDSIRNVRIYQKAIYSEQLYCYAKLCELYKKLALLQGPNANAEYIQKRFSHILSIAASGNLDDFITNEFSEQEIDILKQYARYSQKFNDFKQASEYLSEVIVDE